MLDKQTKRDMKKQRKIIWIFLGVSFPIMLVLVYLLYLLAPSLVNSQWVVITLIVVFGLFLYGGVQVILKKKSENQAKKPKKHDPFAD